MNKRKYPYGVDMCPQLKIHIGEKEVANGVLGPSKMSEVFEKTKRLLYRNAGVSVGTIVQSVSNKTFSDSKSSKQLQLTFDGKLIIPDHFTKNTNMINHGDQQKCNFCAKTERLDFCGTCKEIFCNMCSFSLCSNAINRICLTCYN